ncbi:PREDICTED: ribonuclease P protein subunit p30 isoform X1 [Polistes canadensis]|uniref:ribonuclease P protein subunit p30 isoform X1 n=1 Tax=Polistes canadensis TaxID=91411 RepID=UPI000718C07C|nr:PREDICTED: ribonuclease P protein subunit p30 isoform X1 [Polistes canadensis]
MSMKYNEGYFDLCINASKDGNASDLREILLKSYKLGYRSVAINQIIDESTFETKKKRKKCDDDSRTFLNPIDVDDLVKEFEGKLNIFNRITFAFSDEEKTRLLNQWNVLKKFHVYSVIPKTSEALQFACSQLNTDIITLNASSTQFKMTKKLYMQALDRDIHFEIQYTDVINQESRQLAIHQAHLFYVYGKSKNVIISSGANKVTDIRNPYDVINLAALLGLNENMSKAAILYQNKNLLLRAERRRFGKVFAIKIEEEVKESDSTDSNAKKSKL